MIEFINSIDSGTKALVVIVAMVCISWIIVTLLKRL